MMLWLVGKNGYSFIDPWTLVHFSSWVVVTANLRAFHLPKWPCFFACLLGAYLWEAFERYGEKTWPNVWTHPESWWNSWLSDPLMCVLGFLVTWFLFDRFGG